MVDSGLLLAKGKSYQLNKRSDAYLEWDLTRPPHQRSVVPYNPSFLADYQPNTTFMLSAEQLQAMERIGAVSGLSAAKGLGKNYERVLASLLIDLTHASSNLENVQISWLDTKTLLEFGERPGGLTETQMRIVLNHKNAIAYLMEHGQDLSIARKDLMDIHSLLITGLLKDASAVGCLRKAIVKIDGSQYLPPDNPHQLNEAFEEFCQKAQEIANPYEQAFFAMVFLPYLQPFQDGNKRTSRIVMNIPLVRNELAPFSFSDMGKREYMFGLLAFYERGVPGILAKSFVAAYARSAGRYADMIQHVNAGGILSTISEN